DLIEPFAGYAFNKAHSYSYGTIAYQTAYLKANYPEEYLTAVLRQAPSHPAGTLERIAQAYNECVRLGIPVLPPDVNLSRPSFAQSSQKLRETGQSTMFDLFGAQVATPLSGIDMESAPVPRGEVLAWEKELLGIWLSEHPYTRAASHLAPMVTALCNEFTPE